MGAVQLTVSFWSGTTLPSSRSSGAEVPSDFVNAVVEHG
jgi:hypothetical protein